MVLESAPGRERKMGDKHNRESGIDRRKLLKRTGTVGVGLLGGSALVGSAGARGPPEGRGPPGSNGPPGQSCSCDDSDGDFIAKYEFEDGSFVFEDGDDVVEITVVEVKDDDEDEPITVEFEADGFVVQSVCVFGGLDTDSIEDEDGVERFETDLENPGGQQAAISNITFCGTAEEEPECADLTAEYVCTLQDDGQIVGTRHLVTNNGDDDTDYGWAVLGDPNDYTDSARTVSAGGTSPFTADASSPTDGIVWWEDDEGCDEILTTYAEFKEARGEGDDLIDYIENETAGIPDDAYVAEIDGYPVTDDNEVICD